MAAKHTIDKLKNIIIIIKLETPYMFKDLLFVLFFFKVHWGLSGKDTYTEHEKHSSFLSPEAAVF